ncbi:MAG TPA: hypothetical protein VMS64_31805 [Candidatus Methylomirabilis sp.]|nr:hypothetical protein [Candidatus Methylomirabilis sp.]
MKARMAAQQPTGANGVMVSLGGKSRWDMPDRLESPERVLAANQGENYCADCLGQAAGFTLEEQVISLAKLMRGAYRKSDDRVVEKGVCAVCGRTELIVRSTGSTRSR